MDCVDRKYTNSSSTDETKTNQELTNLIYVRSYPHVTGCGFYAIKLTLSEDGLCVEVDMKKSPRGLFITTAQMNPI